jgi:hypothetical protein
MVSLQEIVWKNIVRNLQKNFLENNKELKSKIDDAKVKGDFGEAFSIIIGILSMPEIKDFIDSNQKEENPYSENIVFVNLLIEFLAYYNFRKDSSLSIIEHKEKAWKNLQKAYFTWNLNFFRVFDYIDNGKRNLMRILADMQTEDMQKNPKFYQSRINMVQGIIDVFKYLPEESD